MPQKKKKKRRKNYLEFFQPCRKKENNYCILSKKTTDTGPKHNDRDTVYFLFIHFCLKKKVTNIMSVFPPTCSKPLLQLFFYTLNFPHWISSIFVKPKHTLALQCELLTTLEEKVTNKEENRICHVLCSESEVVVTSHPLDNDCWEIHGNPLLSNYISEFFLFRHMDSQIR